MGCSFFYKISERLAQILPYPTRTVVHVSFIGNHRTYWAYGITKLKCCVLISALFKRRPGTAGGLMAVRFCISI